MNAISRLEYVLLRVIRKYLLTERLANGLARWLPYYRSSINETNPERIVSAYIDTLSHAGLELAKCSVLEVGAGRTNAVAYSLAAAGADNVLALEPFVKYEPLRDAALLRKNHPDSMLELQQRVRRTTTFDGIPDHSIDVILSNSVLEHVLDLERFFSSCHRVLRPGSGMLHIVDYRDHFFKYPYAFLTFSEKTWSRWLNPGDLPRWRLYDHVAAMQQAGFRVDVVTKDTLAAEFARIQDLLAPPFADAHGDVAVTYAVVHGHLAR